MADGIGPNATANTGSSDDYALAYVDRNVHVHTMVVQLGNGYSVKVDVNADKVYVTKGLQTKTFKLDDVLLRASNGNPRLAAQKKAQLVTALSDPIGNARLQRLDAQTAETYARTSPNAMLPPHSTYRSDSAHLNFRLPPSNISIGSEPPFVCNPLFQCDYQPQLGDNIGLGSGSGEFGFWFYDKNSSPGGEPPDKQDYDNWNRWRKDHCDDAKKEWQTADVAAAALGYAIYVAETPVGWLGAAVAGLAVAVAGSQATSDQRVCDSRYPGKGNW